MGRWARLEKMGEVLEALQKNKYLDKEERARRVKFLSAIILDSQ